MDHHAKAKKYVKKIEMYEPNLGELVNEETKKKIIEMIKNKKYYEKVITNTNPSISNDVYADQEVIVLTTGDSAHKIVKYCDTIIKLNDIKQELFDDELLKICDDVNCKNINMTDTKYNGFIDYQIMLGYFYKMSGCAERLGLIDINKLNLLTRYIVKLVQTTS